MESLDDSFFQMFVVLVISSWLLLDSFAFNSLVMVPCFQAVVTIYEVVFAGDCWRFLLGQNSLPSEPPSLAIEGSYGTPMNGLMKLVAGAIAPKTGGMALLITGFLPTLFVLLWDGSKDQKVYRKSFGPYPTQVEDENFSPQYVNFDFTSTQNGQI